MDNGLWTEKFSDEPITGKVYGYFGEVKPLKKVYVGNLRNGKKEGKWISYYHSIGIHLLPHNCKFLLTTKKKYDYNYKDGKKDGVCTWWNENGNKKEEIDDLDGRS